MCCSVYYLYNPVQMNALELKHFGNYDNLELSRIYKRKGNTMLFLHVLRELPLFNTEKHPSDHAVPAKKEVPMPAKQNGKKPKRTTTTTQMSKSEAKNSPQKTTRVNRG